MHTVTDVCNLRKRVTPNNAVLNKDILIFFRFSTNRSNAMNLELDSPDEDGLLDVAQNVTIVKPCYQERSFIIRAERLQERQWTAVLEVHTMGRIYPSVSTFLSVYFALGLTTK